jgi:flagellin
MVIEHNIPAMNTNRFLGINSNLVSESLEKLSSGLRINKAADDAAGLAISEKMRNQIRGLEMAEQNAKNGISLIQTAEGALNETHSILARMRELAVQSSNGTYDEGDRQMITEEFDQLKGELDRIAESTHYNGIKLLDGSLSAKGVSATSGAGANTGTFIPSTKAEFVIDASDAFGAAEKAVYEYDLSGLAVKAAEGTDVFDNLGAVGGIDAVAGEKVFSVAGYDFNFKSGDTGTLAGTTATFGDFASLQKVVNDISTPDATWTFSLSDEGVLSLTADVAGAVGGATAGVPAAAPADFVLEATLTADGVTPETIAVTEVNGGRDAGPLDDPNATAAVAPTVKTAAAIDTANTGTHGVTAIDWAFSGVGESFNGAVMSAFTLNDDGANDYFSFELGGETFKSATFDSGAADATTSLDGSRTWVFTSEDDATHTATLSVTGGAASANGTKMNGFVTDVAAGTYLEFNEDGVAATGRVKGEYGIGGQTFEFDAADGDADDFKFNTIEGLVAELEDAFGDEYTFAANDDGTITATAINAGSATGGGATINLDEDAAKADSSVVTGAMGIDEFKTSKAGANTISSALTDVLEFGNTGVVKGTGTEYRVSADKVGEFISSLNIADTSGKGILDALGLATQDYSISNETGEDLIITAKASGIDPNEEKLLLHSQQEYRGMLYKEKDGTDDYRNLTVTVDANKVGDTKFIGSTMQINGRTYQFTGQSDKNDVGEFAKAGDKLDNGNYAIDIGALADEDDGAYAAGITQAIVDAVNTVEETLYEVPGTKFAEMGNGLDANNKAKDYMATFSIRLNTSGVSGNANAGGLVFQIGANGSDDQRISLNVNAMDTKSIGESGVDVEYAALTGMSVADASVGTIEDANKAIDILDGATQMVSAQRANLGAMQNRLESTLNSLGVSIENLSSAESIIRDTDMAKEMMDFTKNQIKLQAAQAMLAQANSLPQGVLQLLR